MTSEVLMLGLGSNLGPSKSTLLWAIEELERFLGPLLKAPLYRTSPVSPIPQRDYMNTVVVGRTRWAASENGSGFSSPNSPGPEEILAFTKALELAAGRRRSARWGPRSLDIDLLLLGDYRSERPELTLPHPRLAQRRFVLAPLADVCPDLRLPPSGKTAPELLESLDEGSWAERLEWS